MDSNGTFEWALSIKEKPCDYETVKAEGTGELALPISQESQLEVLEKLKKMKAERTGEWALLPISKENQLEVLQTLEKIKESVNDEAPSNLKKLQFHQFVYEMYGFLFDKNDQDHIWSEWVGDNSKLETHLKCKIAKQFTAGVRFTEDKPVCL
ncbi:uncharacterized protein LOC106652071 [Trichogramma pretiosum]|uniref:uncharacterized protein LOC106652071 n=1 Tax=Trichogramma pretiosum TaxID=7493 RepID=UPI0006C9795C|nr:uncharacterized protein LOC106652071 [Trichogramma pretiosum]